VYAKGTSDIIAKLRGTYNVSTTAPAVTISTELQKSIFNAPPSLATAAMTVQPPTTVNEAAAEGLETQASQGTKRPRDEESDEGDAPMEEDESDVSMEASSDED